VGGQTGIYHQIAHMYSSSPHEFSSSVWTRCPAPLPVGGGGVTQGSDGVVGREVKEGTGGGRGAVPAPT
jgi:hypothetical protein